MGETEVKRDFSTQGKPTDNAYNESFNGSFRDKYLNVKWFLNLEDAQQKVEVWIQEYFRFSPLNYFRNLTPDEVVERRQ